MLHNFLLRFSSNLFIHHSYMYVVLQDFVHPQLLQLMLIGEKRRRRKSTKSDFYRILVYASVSGRPKGASLSVFEVQAGNFLHTHPDK